MSEKDEKDKKDKKLEWWKILLIIVCIILGLIVSIMIWLLYFREEKIKQKKEFGFFQPSGTKIPKRISDHYFDQNSTIYDLSSD